MTLQSCLKQGFQGGFSEFSQKNLNWTLLAFLWKNIYFSVFLTIFGLSSLNRILEKRLEAEKMKKVESGPSQGPFGKNQTFGQMVNAAEFFFQFFWHEPMKYYICSSGFQWQPKNAFSALYPIYCFGHYFNLLFCYIKDKCSVNKKWFFWQKNLFLFTEHWTFIYQKNKLQ